MTQLPPPYPLAWPDGVPRTKRPSGSQFRTGLPGAMKNVAQSIAAFGRDSGAPVARQVITSNAALGAMRPADAGVAVWFDWHGALHCIAVDRYAKVEENLQAIHHVLEARRTEIRHAGIEVARAAFRGFQTALPAPDAWWKVLGFDGPGQSAEAVEAAWKRLTRENANGIRSEARQLEINVARDRGREA